MNREWEKRGVFRLGVRTVRDLILQLQAAIKLVAEKEKPLKPQTSINAILDALAVQKSQGETSLIITIGPDIIADAMKALRDYRKLFAPVIPGETDTAPIYAAYEEMRRHADPTQHTLLLFVECRTIEEFREALDPLPMRNSSEWKAFDNGL